MKSQPWYPSPGLWKGYPLKFRGGRKAPNSKYKEALRKDPCSYCGSAADGIDHITPRSHKGTNTFHNLTSACSRCNSRKASTKLIFFLLRNVEC